MPVFAYQALDARQSPHSGTIAADTAALARHLLRGQGLAVARIEPVKRQQPRLWRRMRRDDEQIAELWRNLAVLLEAGVPLAEALDVCLRQQRGSVQAVLRQLADSIRQGRSLAEALADHPGQFDAITLTIVRVGEQSGALSAALNELAEHQTRRRAIVNRLGTALIYPAILVLVGTAVVIFLMSHVVPQLLEVLAAAGRDLPAPTRLLKSLSDGLIAYWPLLVGAVVAVFVGLAAMKRHPRGRRLLERAVLSVPVLGDLIRKSWVARISMMLAVLLHSDVRFDEALRTVRSNLSHGLYADALTRLEQAIEAGSAIADPLRDDRLMPPLFVHLLGVGQESGELPRMLAQLRDSYEKSVNLALTRFLAVLEPALIILLAIVIGFVVFATLLPILETTKVVQ